jgi:hypothetical protein
MGLDCSHDAFHGSYGTFGEWRMMLANIAAELELPPDSSLYILLNHSDCEGEIATEYCDPIANELIKLLPHMHRNWLGRTAQFIAGLHAAAYSHESLDFH